jgi:hypothetical protein
MMMCIMMMIHIFSSRLVTNRRKLGLVGLILLRLILIGFGVFGRGLLDVLGLNSFVWYAFIFILYYSISINPLPRR